MRLGCQPGGGWEISLKPCPKRNTLFPSKSVCPLLSFFFVQIWSKAMQDRVEIYAVETSKWVSAECNYNVHLTLSSSSSTIFSCYNQYRDCVDDTSNSCIFFSICIWNVTFISIWQWQVLKRDPSKLLTIEVADKDRWQLWFYSFGYLT